MKFKYFVVCFFLGSFIFASCSKSGTKALEQGDYYNAVILAVEKLKKDPDNDKSLSVLPEAYSFAKKDLLSDISIGQSSNQAYKWERVLENYNKLNKMHDLISKCTACRRQVSPTAYFKETESTRELAAEERYISAMKNLKLESIDGGRAAFRDLNELFQFAPNYKDVRSKLDDALNMGSIHVVVEPAMVNSRIYKLSSDYFNDRVNEFLTENKRMNEFIRFYSPSEAETVGLKPDHIVKLEFLDFVVGETFLESKKETLTSADSVKTGTVTIRGKKVDAYDKVKADYTYNNKVISSKGILGLTIIDYARDKQLLKREMPGEFVWRNEWSTYNGDERALDDKQLKMTKAKEILPPAPEALFVEFCKPIHSQVTSEIRKFYNNY
ncbi:hypothetical protein SAMN06298216_0993 [Spirosomataceae bacterium TFI 002]|nr:hypothetical protein SAMN06298216_0993 [Spirosomataceae bacterium TFI 002]